MNKEWDVFISHAHEDKDEIAKPLAKALANLGIKVWYDEFCFQPGDNIRSEIDNGLVKSEFGIVILSKVFLEKYWTNYELDGLFTLDSNSNNARIIPIWHNLEKSDVLEYSPSLAMKFALNTNQSNLEDIVLHC